jgi:hypothetical protein
VEKFSSHQPCNFFTPLKGKKNSANKTQIFLVQILIKLTLKKVQETFPELFPCEKEFLRGGMRIFHVCEFNSINEILKVLL